MRYYEHKEPVKRYVLDGEGLTTRLKELLGYFVDDVPQAYHELMNRLVESARCKDKAMAEISANMDALEYNVPQDFQYREELIHVMRDLSLLIFFQIDNHRLYNERGMLDYVYERHPDMSFSDIVLRNILLLPYHPRPRRY